MAKKKSKTTKDQIDFLTGESVDDSQIEAAKEILLNAGYKVEKINVTTKARKIQDIKNHFYNRLWAKYPDRYSNRVSNIERDMRFASLFVESRMNPKTVGKVVALQECMDIIDIIFDYEEEFMFKTPIMDITILGQGKLGWITQKAVEILNREKGKEIARESEKMLKELEESMEIDLNEKSNELINMLKNLEEKDG